MRSELSRRSVILLGAAIAMLMVCGCDKATLPADIPNQFRGVWRETSDMVLSSRKTADEIIIAAGHIAHVRYTPFASDPPRTLNIAAISVRTSDSRCDVHYDSQLFGKQIYRLLLETDVMFLNVYEIAPAKPSAGLEREEYFRGRFVRQQ